MDISNINIGTISLSKNKDESFGITPKARTAPSKTIIHRNVANPRLQEKTATSNGNVTADIGYDGLSKVTVNVSGNSVAYYWSLTDGTDTSGVYLDFSVAIESDWSSHYKLTGDIVDGLSKTSVGSGTYTKVSDTEFTITGLGDDKTYTYTRDSSLDITLW